MRVSFQQIKTNYVWEPIANCPDRYRLKNIAPGLSLDDLLGKEKKSYAIHKFHVQNARDIVLVVIFDGGWIISYKKLD